MMRRLMAAVSLPSLLLRCPREHGGQVLAFQEAPGEHQRVPTHGGVWLGRVEHEPGARQPYSLGDVVAEQLDGVVVGAALAF
jgi:hypothetical protein